MVNGSNLELLRTPTTSSWYLLANEVSFLNQTIATRRNMNFDPSVPFIMVPSKDFSLIA
jgi:hypothetical protein